MSVTTSNTNVEEDETDRDAMPEVAAYIAARVAARDRLKLLNRLIADTTRQSKLKDEMADFRKRIAAKNSRYARKLIYGGPATHDDEGKQNMVKKYVGTGIEQQLVPVVKEATAKAVILVGYCPDTLAYFNAMFDEAKKTFPDLHPGGVTCGKVLESSYVKGFTVILFDVPNKPHEGWTYYDSNLDFRY